MKSETFFSEKEKKDISSAITEVETQTAGEVAVMVVDQSDDYPEGKILAGILMGSVAALGITEIFFGESLWYFVPLTAILSFVFGWGAGYMPALLRIFTPGTRLDTKVQERALLAFYEKELYKTRDDTGVLFFLSLLEHKVWILADKGIYSKISQDDLQEFALEVAQGVKNGRACEVLCKEIRRVGTILRHHFPVKPDDINELSNEVIVGK